MDAKCEVTLDADFLAAAEAAQREPSEIFSEFMREFVEREKRDYLEFLRRKVEKARQSYRDGHWSTNEEVEQEFAAKRRALALESDNGEP